MFKRNIRISITFSYWPHSSKIRSSISLITSNKQELTIDLDFESIPNNIIRQFKFSRTRHTKKKEKITKASCKTKSPIAFFLSLLYITHTSHDISNYLNHQFLASYTDTNHGGSRHEQLRNFPFRRNAAARSLPPMLLSPSINSLFST